MADVLDHAQIMRNEKIGQVILVLQVHHQVDDLRLNRNIQRRDRFIADDQVGVQRQCPCDADALALAAGKFVRIGVHQRGTQPNPGEQRRHPILPLTRRAGAMNGQRLTNDVPGGHARV